MDHEERQTGIRCPGPTSHTKTGSSTTDPVGFRHGDTPRGDLEACTHNARRYILADQTSIADQASVANPYTNSVFVDLARFRSDTLVRPTLAWSLDS